MLTVVGICGHNRAGKDTVASVLTSVGGFVRVGLADGVREMIGGLNGPSWELFKDLDAAEAGAIREAMKLAGTECREDVDAAGHWVQHALMKIRYLSHYHPVQRLRFVIPDVRFPHEPTGLRKSVEAWGGRYFTVKVIRPGCGATTLHSSETGVDRIPTAYHVANNGTRADLIRRATEIAACWSGDTVLTDIGGTSEIP